jgi:hypothetical protein
MSISAQPVAGGSISAQPNHKAEKPPVKRRIVARTDVDAAPEAR